MVILTPVFGVLANRIGVKKVLIMGTLGYAPYSASLYVNNRYGTEWFVLFGGVTCGIAASALWASEGAIALGYGDVKDRGKFSEQPFPPLTPSSPLHSTISPMRPSLTRRRASRRHRHRHHHHQRGSGWGSANWGSSSARPSSCR